ncbi:uncharacterized protein EAE97_009354 [Botrytis byssoidea]|uniref:Uncharacterized protein n=1 Tax=Botrytis byssoidea TaxID=139641 RepID=A0A9P5I804_9HELO|nr:uncharacterized protein EAE97_009354 [Botrytis byssoidea]KAF7931145.1 hypothetical protein EAE97_009354 [Botrytis byssoidea]
MPDGRQTTNGDYEDISWYTFADIDQPRLMSWEARSDSDRSYIGIGTNNVISTHFNTSVSQKDYELPSGWIVLVADFKKFKLVMKT